MGEIVPIDVVNIPFTLNLTKLENLLLESFDIAFTLCNKHFKKYGPDKVSFLLIPTELTQRHKRKYKRRGTFKE